MAWEAGFVDTTSDEALNGNGKASPKLQDAMDWLHDELKDGWVQRDDIYIAAERVGISQGTLRRAKEKLGVESKGEGFSKYKIQYWHLPGIPKNKD